MKIALQTTIFSILPTLFCVAAEPDRFRLATATPGGGFQLYGTALAEAVSKTSDLIRIETVESGGSAGNFNLLLSGDVDLARAQGGANSGRPT